jgi:non-homologous end joining protein Ku
LAAALIEAFQAHFEPAKYRDRYRENLRGLLEAKIQGEERRLQASPRMPSTIGAHFRAAAQSRPRQGGYTPKMPIRPTRIR